MIEEALTFDDVLLQPSESSIGPGDADVKTKLTNKIHLNIPLISSAMDTVTEHKLAIAIAQLGGIGVIHKNFSIEINELHLSKIKDISNANTDVCVRFEDGFCLNVIVGTPQNLQYLIEKDEVNFWEPGLPWVIVQNSGEGSNSVVKVIF